MEKLKNTMTFEGASFRKLDARESRPEASWKVGALNDVTYAELKDIFGEPTINTASGDNKVQVEWAIEVVEGDSIYELRIYDWKTYDRHETLTSLKTWSIGGTNEANPYLLKCFVREQQLIHYF